MLMVSIVLIYPLYLTKDFRKKMNTTMGLFAKSSGMGNVFKATPLWPPRYNSMAEGTVEGFFLSCQSAKKKNN
jgi:hypothetical protein